MEIKGYDAAGVVIWIDELKYVRAVEERNGTYYDLHLLEGVARETEESLDRHYPGWRDYLLTEFEPDDWSELSDAVCASQRIDDPGPTVYGEVDGHLFEIQGVWARRSGGEVSLPAGSRERFRQAVSQDKREKLPPWDHFDRDMYGGFYVPAEWLDTFYLKGA